MEEGKENLEVEKQREREACRQVNDFFCYIIKDIGWFEKFSIPNIFFHFGIANRTRDKKEYLELDDNDISLADKVIGVILNNLSYLQFTTISRLLDIDMRKEQKNLFEYFNRKDIILEGFNKFKKLPSQSEYSEPTQIKSKSSESDKIDIRAIPEPIEYQHNYTLAIVKTGVENGDYLLSYFSKGDTIYNIKINTSNVGNMRYF